MEDEVIVGIDEQVVVETDRSEVVGYLQEHGFYEESYLE